jgi:hypothetical protein
LQPTPRFKNGSFTCPEPYDNEKPEPPSPGVDHHVENDRLHLAVLEIAFEK